VLTLQFPCLTCLNLSSASSTSSKASSSSQSIVLVFDASSSSVTSLYIASSSTGLSSSRASLPPDVLAFLDEPCTGDLQCITGLCRNNLCTACVKDGDCASGLCRGGICLQTDLPNGAACSEDAQCLSGLCFNHVCTDRSALPADVVIDPVTGQPLLTSPDETLPATVIELPFISDAGGRADTGLTADIVTKDIPATPSTGPAALAVMLAGGAAGWVYRRRR
jgi:hypothetical protein